MVRDLGLTHVIVDGPQGLESSVPPIAAVTTPELAMVRLHGRRADTWEAANVPTVERYRYLYTPAELDAIVPRSTKCPPRCGGRPSFSTTVTGTTARPTRARSSRD
jgi:uncharacterized protein YecE (DUF72 family)